MNIFKLFKIVLTIFQPDKGLKKHKTYKLGRIIWMPDHFNQKIISQLINNVRGCFV
jgi:hypothetical protein